MPGQVENGPADDIPLRVSVGIHADGHENLGFGVDIERGVIEGSSGHPDDPVVGTLQGDGLSYSLGITAEATLSEGIGEHLRAFGFGVIFFCGKETPCRRNLPQQGEETRRADHNCDLCGQVSLG